MGDIPFVVLHEAYNTFLRCRRDEFRVVLEQLNGGLGN